MAYIMLVEDEPWLGELYEQLLSGNGHTVIWCRDCYDAIGRIDTSPPELIVLDMLLPWANGLQLLHELASHADLSSIPVILCSAVSLTNDIEILNNYGIYRVLDKTTMQPHHLLNTVKEALYARNPN